MLRKSSLMPNSLQERRQQIVLKWRLSSFSLSCWCWILGVQPDSWFEAAAGCFSTKAVWRCFLALEKGFVGQLMFFFGNLQFKVSLCVGSWDVPERSKKRVESGRKHTGSETSATSQSSAWHWLELICKFIAVALTLSNRNSEQIRNYVAVDLNSFICKRPFFANKKKLLSRISREHHVCRLRGSHVKIFR